MAVNLESVHLTEQEALELVEMLEGFGNPHPMSNGLLKLKERLQGELLHSSRRYREAVAAKRARVA